jgi:hypothetical protein
LRGKVRARKNPMPKYLKNSKQKEVNKKDGRICNEFTATRGHVGGVYGMFWLERVKRRMLSW